MKPFLLAIFISSFAAGVQAQQVPRYVLWNGSPSCGFTSPKALAADQLSCSTISTARGPVSIVQLGGITLSVAFLEDRDHLIVGAQILNNTSESVGFDTDLWGAAHFQTQKDFTKKLRPIVAETSIPTRDLIRTLAYGTKLGTSVDSAIADTQVVGQTKEIRRSDGARYRVDVVVPDADARAAAARQGTTRMEQVAQQQARIRATALTSKSVLSGRSVKGLVYFRRVKEADFVVFSLRVGETSFMFQLPRKKD